MKIRIQTKLVGLLLVVALVPLCLLAGVAYYSWQENQEREIGAALGRTAGQTMDLVDRLLFFCQEDLQAWALTEAMQDAVAEDADGRITATLMRLKKGYGIYSGIYCVSPEGKIIASSEPESLGADVAGTPWFKAAKTADGAVCHGLINEPLLHGFAVGFTTPVRAAFDTGDGNAPPVIAYLSSRLNWSELFSITSNLQVVAGGQDERGYAVLIDDQGYLLSGPGFLLAEESADPDRMSMVNLAGLVSAASDEINESGYAVVPDTLDQSALVGYAMSQGYQGFAGLGWGTVVVERTDVAFAPIRQLRWQFLLLLGATAGLVVVLAWISARHVSVPIRRLTDVALAIGAGDLDQSIDLRSGDEIGELAVTINQTTRRLKQARGDLMAAKEYTDSILRSLSNGVLSIDLDGRITQVNDAAGRLFAERPDALMGRPLDAIIGDANAWLLASLDKVRAQGSMDMVLDADLTMPGRDLVSVNLATVPLRNQAGEVIGLILVLEDISMEKRLRGTMQRYMTKEVADRLMEGGEAMLGGTLQETSVLFSDIRGFTSLSEKLTAQETVQLLNEYLSLMVDVVFTHQGVLDKYVGDAIMALFGVPFRGSDDPDRAVQAGLDMLAALDGYNTHRVRDGQAPLRVGIGINTDEVVAGNIGSLKRMDYTVIGDGVNLASRLEGANKFYGTRLLISERTRQRLSRPFVIRQVDRIRAKGKAQPVAIYEVIEPARAAQLGDVAAWTARWDEVLGLYRSRQWAEARALLGELRQVPAGDSVAEFYSRRVEALLAEPPGDDWDGVWVLTEK